MPPPSADPATAAAGGDPADGVPTGRLVVIGAGGMLGRTVSALAAARGREVCALTSAQCDLTDPQAPARHLLPGDVVLNCAAFTQVDAAQDDFATAFAVNAEGAGRLAATAAAVGAALVHISTDYVFGGAAVGTGDPAARRPYEVDDAPAPVNVYGASKLAGEQAVLAAHPGARVVRTAWVFTGGTGMHRDSPDFVATMRRRAAGSGPVEVVADQLGSPTSVFDLARAVLDLPAGSEPILHAVNTGAASRYDQAVAVFELLGVDPARVRPVGSDRHPRPAPRPMFSALATDRSTAAGLPAPRSWRAALAEALTGSADR